MNPNPNRSALAAIADQPDDNSIGASLKRRRRAKKWSLKVLSEKSGIPVSTLSKVENGLMSLRIEKLLAVSNALDVDVMQLVSPEESDSPVALVTGRRSITRGSAAPRTKTENTVYEHHASDFSRRMFSPTVIEVQPGITPELIRHQGEEFIYVLEGRVEALTEFYEPTILETGDSMYIDSTMAHNVRALDDKRALILNVSSVKRTLSGE
ncbi:MAG: XRE family transcriptional regulator [Hyphococcus sp.]|nr:MAG: XRE family transcriptional regulator [Marinicaulis sp.]